MKKKIFHSVVAVVMITVAMVNLSMSGAAATAPEEELFGTVPNRTDEVFFPNTPAYCVWQCYKWSNWDCTFTPNYGYDCPPGFDPGIDPGGL